MSFHVGQKVCCIDARMQSDWTVRWLHQGAVYVISAIGNDPPITGELFRGLQYQSVRLHGVKKPGFFAALRFTPLQERKTDISALKALLVPGAKIRETA